LIIATLLLSIFGMLLKVEPAHAQEFVSVRVLPETIEFGPGNAVGQTFDVGVVVENITDLAGVAMVFRWDTEYLDHVSHVITMPVESFPNPIPPSPYPGTLHSPPLQLADIVNEAAGTYEVGFATLGGPSFNGSGTVFVMTLNVTRQPDEGLGETDVIFNLDFFSTDLARSTAAGGGSIPHDVYPATVTIRALPFQYPPWPLLKIMPETVEDVSMGNSFTSDVWLMGDGGVGLDAFWDIGGIDVIMRFNNTLLEATGVTIDPDGWFAGFYPTVLTITNETNNAEGTVHVSFFGYGINHTEPSEQGRVFSVDFTSIFDSPQSPPPSEPIYLEGPIAFTGRHHLHSENGLIDVNDPIGTTWNELAPSYLAGPVELVAWEDNGDGELGLSDQVLLNNTATGYYFDYHVVDKTGTLNLTLESWTDFDIWATNSITEDGLANFGMPGRLTAPTDPGAYNGFGLPDWTGNFTVTFPFLGVSSITVHALPYTADEFTYTLTAGVDYEVHVGDQLIELLTPVDEQIINEHWKDGVNNTLNGWPIINYIATGIQSVFVDMNNGTARFGTNLGFEMAPPAEWWYEPDWPGELEGWWALGYFVGPFNWPAGSDWYINYTAASWIEVNYLVEPAIVFVDYDGSYADFLAITDATNTVWNEIYPRSWQSYNFTTYTDGGAAGLSVGDRLATATGIGYYVEGMGTDLTLDRKPWVCDEAPTDEFFGDAPIVEVAGWAHPERAYCPWHNAIFSPKLPHNVEEAYFEAYFLPPGAWIDLYVCDGTRPDPFGGQGPNQPSDMFWPQKEVTLCANVTYNFWPEQYKDVAFHIYMPNAELYAVLYGKTDENGHCVVTFRLPWPCEDWPDVIGVWHIEAFVDVACVVVNDTLDFHYDYLVNIMNVETDKDAYKHCEDIHITVTFTSHAQMPQNVTITVTIVDETGVPFGYVEVGVPVGGAVFCTPSQYVVEVTLHVVKWARAGEATVFAGSLAYRGDPAGPGFEPPPTIGILAEWA